MVTKIGFTSLKDKNMCLYIAGRQERKCTKAYKIVYHYPGREKLNSIYYACSFSNPFKWQKIARKRIHVENYEKAFGKIDKGYHLFPTLQSAKRTLNSLPGTPLYSLQPLYSIQGNSIQGMEIWECKVRQKDYVASGTFELDNKDKVSSVVYNTFKFVKKINT
jgi:hypothetical protein